jgi:hypothetical protein
MIKTNSKALNEKIKKLVVDCYNDSAEYYAFEGRQMATDYPSICKDILNAFYNEKEKHNLQYKAGRISRQDLFMDWMQGLPTAFYIADDIFLADATEFVGNLLEQTESEKAKYTTEQAEKLACYLFYRELTKHSAK